MKFFFFIRVYRRSSAAGLSFSNLLVAPYQPGGRSLYPVGVRWLYTLLISAACAQMSELPRTIQQGNTLRIHGSPSAVAARMNDRTIRLFPQSTGSLGLLPVPADQQPGEYKLDLLDREGTPLEPVSIRVLDT